MKIPLLYRLATLPVVGEIIIKPTTKSLTRFGLKKRFYNPALVTEELVNISYNYLKMPKMKDTLLNIIRSNISIVGPRTDEILTDKLHLVKSPTLIIHGAHDSVMPIEDARNACNLIPKATLIVFDECNHNPHIEKANEFNEAVIKFLSSES